MGSGCSTAAEHSGGGRAGAARARKYEPKRRHSFNWLVRDAGVNRELAEEVYDIYYEGVPDAQGQLDHDGFCRALGLGRDAYTNRLVRIFDLDNSGQVGFREFVYGLSKFASEDFERVVQFAYRLFDLDGDGTLDKDELYQALKNALRTDPSKYTLAPPKVRRVVKGVRAQVKPKVRRSLKEVKTGAGNQEWSQVVRSDPQLRKEVDDLAGRRQSLSYVDFQVIVSHQPRLMQAAQYLYLAMQSRADAAAAIMEEMSEDAEGKLLESLNRSKGDGENAFWDKPGLSSQRMGSSNPTSPSGGARNKDADADAFEVQKDAAEERTLALASAAMHSPVSAPPPGAPPDGVDESAESVWACSNCTLNNHILDRFCAACGAQRPAGATAAAVAAAERAAAQSSGIGSKTTSPGTSGAYTHGSIDVNMAIPVPEKLKGTGKYKGAGLFKATAGGPTTGDTGASTEGDAHARGDGHASSASSSPSRARSGSAPGASETRPHRASAPDDAFERAFADVRRWLQSLQLHAYVDTFRGERVDSRELIMMMSEEDLKELGLPKGPRLRILNQQRREAKSGGEGEGDPNPRLCRICMANDIEVLLRPCGHTMLCQRCAYSVTECPICRIDISERVRSFAV